ncbi:MAG: hypothetical protein NTW28_09635 [Candidatus Solibacter sp.]|nr:hypothetical protein [Candidatus Solibacter sp.]
MIAFSGFRLPVTGAANHVYGFLPPSVAQHAWMSAHNILSLLFMMFSIWHIVLNRRVLWRQIRAAAASVPVVSREAISASVVVALLTFLFAGHGFHVGGQ